MDDPELELVDAIGRGDHEAFESLVQRYQGPLLNFITRYVGDRCVAEDLTQEVFIRVYRAAARFRPERKVSTWVFQIAYNLAMTEIGRRKRHHDLYEALCRRRDEGAEEAPAGPAERYELEEEIMSALGRLPDNQRAALLLRINQDLPYREIGEILGVSVQSVESLLFRARTSLRRYLGKM